jgi:hypothetical protein
MVMRALPDGQTTRAEVARIVLAYNMIRESSASQLADLTLARLGLAAVATVADGERIEPAEG